MDSFASRLRYAIERSGMQQKNLAAAIRLSPARLSNYVNGHSEPSLDILLLLCRELKISADYLIGLSDNIHAHIPRNPLDNLTPDQIKHVTKLINSFEEENERITMAELASKQEA